MNKLICLLFSFLLIFSHSQTVSEVDFLLGAVYTGNYMWQNSIGLSMDYDNIEPHMNSSLFQGYQRNAILDENLDNEWTMSLHIPLGHKYNCTVLANPNVVCHFETEGNDTYYDRMVAFIAHTVYFEYWALGYDIQGVDLSNTVHRKQYEDWLFSLYAYSGVMFFASEIVDYGDKMVERGYKTGTYTPSNFLRDIENAGYVSFKMGHSGPGITDEASSEWLTSQDSFYKISKNGHFTARCVVFPDPTKVTIESILSDDATKYYLRNRFTTNDSFTYTDFGRRLAINDIKLTTGMGVDGVTNTFAAALWALDMILEFAQLNGKAINFNHFIGAGNFQSILGPAPDYKPTPMYYAMMLATAIRSTTPEIVLPSTKAITSSKIKAYGFSDGNIFQVLLINKDTNTSLNGKVLVKSVNTNALRCYTLEAPSLMEKSDVTLNGLRFIGGNATVQGDTVRTKVTYNYDSKGYEIPIKYAQAVLCETPDIKFKWFTGEKTTLFGGNLVSSLSVLSLVLMMILSF